MESKFSKQVDSIDCSSSQVAVGLSSLEGNTWDGSVSVLGTTDANNQVLTENFKHGVCVVKFFNPSNDFETAEAPFILCGDDSGDVTVLTSADLSRKFCVSAHDSCASALTFHHNSDEFISGGWDGSIRIWKFSHDACSTAPVQAATEAHFKCVHDMSTNPSDAATFCSVGQDGFLRLWDKRQRMQNGCSAIHSFKQSLSCVEWDLHRPDNILLGSDSGSIFRVDIRKNYVLPVTVAENIAHLANGTKYCCSTTTSGLKTRQFSTIHSGRVRAIKTSPYLPAGTFASCSDDRSVVISQLPEYNNCTVAKNTDNSCTELVAKVLSRATPHSDYISGVQILPASTVFAEDQFSDQSTGYEQECTGFSSTTIPTNCSKHMCTILTASYDKTIKMAPLAFTL